MSTTKLYADNIESAFYVLSRDASRVVACCICTISNYTVFVNVKSNVARLFMCVGSVIGWLPLPLFNTKK